MAAPIERVLPRNPHDDIAHMYICMHVCACMHAWVGWGVKSLKIK